MLPKGPLIVAKIEKDQALEHIEEIVRATDAVMVARGDLGVELPFERVPLAQKQIIAIAQRLGRPVITATQMLESMIEHPRPTRAEASDVANAILDGTDAVMLSAETAAGAYPRLAVEAMRRIIHEIETHPVDGAAMRDERRVRGLFVTTEEAIAAATVAAARQLAAPLVIVFSKSGFTGRIVAGHRPRCPSWRSPTSRAWPGSSPSCGGWSPSSCTPSTRTSAWWRSGSTPRCAAIWPTPATASS
jgi:pyruvate kinase